MEGVAVLVSFSCFAGRLHTRTRAMRRARYDRVPLSSRRPTTNYCDG